MASAPERSKITAALKGILVDDATVDQPVGVVIAPAGAGWDKDPATSGAQFTPYFVITPGTAQPVNPSIADPSQDWRLAYQITSYGVDPTQIEEVADAARKLLLDTKNVEVIMSDGTWKVKTIACPNIGGVGYTTAISPPAYSQTDSYSLSLSRSIA